MAYISTRGSAAKIEVRADQMMCTRRAGLRGRHTDKGHKLALDKVASAVFAHGCRGNHLNVAADLSRQRRAADFQDIVDARNG